MRNGFKIGEITRQVSSKQIQFEQHERSPFSMYEWIVLPLRTSLTARRVWLHPPESVQITSVTSLNNRLMLAFFQAMPRRIILITAFRRICIIFKGRTVPVSISLEEDNWIEGIFVSLKGSEDNVGLPSNQGPSAEVLEY